MSDRKITRADYALIKRVAEKHLALLQKSNAKAWYKFIDVKAVMDFLYQHEHCYIVGEAYLVVYDVATPWFAKDGVIFLNEIIVLRLVRGNEFSIVPAFLERKAREAGAVLTGVGTALARFDAALAQIYQQYGYKPETIVLTKEL